MLLWSSEEDEDPKLVAELRFSFGLSFPRHEQNARHQGAKMGKTDNCTLQGRKWSAYLHIFSLLCFAADLRLSCLQVRVAYFFLRVLRRQRLPDMKETRARE